MMTRIAEAFCIKLHLREPCHLGPAHFVGEGSEPLIPSPLRPVSETERLALPDTLLPLLMR